MMRRIPALVLRPRNLGRLAAVLLIGLLSALGGQGRPRPAHAEVDLQAPHVLSLRMEQPDTAYITFRETNDVGADVQSNGLFYVFVGQPHPGTGYTPVTSTAAAGNGRTHTITMTGLFSGVTFCFTGVAARGGSDLERGFLRLLGTPRASGVSDEVCGDMSSAATDVSPLPCGIAGVKVTDANMPIRDYDYTYYCDGSFRFHVTALFDTRPFNNDPANADKHLAFEMLKDGNTQIIVSWLCPTDPWGVADTATCTQRADPDVQNPNPNFAVQNGPLPLSVRFLNDEDRQQIANNLRMALSSLSGSNLPPEGLASGPAPSSGSAPAATLPKPPAAPANFKGVRTNPTDPAITLSWDAAAGADYYYLTAYSHTGGDPVALHDPAPKLDKSMTQFIVGSGDNAANIQGGVDFKLQACNAGGCSPTLTATVP